ncbi:MAG: UbiD family decarboxylase [Chloroflexi bacterium]|nr:UbiD family decarboxylase [Chloroflexota bacterium]
MHFSDLREFLEAVDRIGELKTVCDADPLRDIGPITEILAWSPEHPMVLFDRIPGVAAGMRVAVHAGDSYRRMQLIYGFPDGMRGKQLVNWWKARLDNYAPIPPEVVSTGAVMDNVLEGDAVDLCMFPAPLWHAEDAAPYLATGGASVLRDPDTGRLNIGCYRGMVYDRDTLGHHLAGGHDGQVIRDKYFERGQDCPIAVSLGNDPAFTIAAAENLRYAQTELDFGGFLRGAPFQVINGPLTGLPFPATAEAVLEGAIVHPDREPRRTEGPWGEGLGYYAAGFPQPPLKVRAIYFRDNPIVLGDPTLRFKNRGAAGGFATTARRWHMLEQSGLQGIQGIGQVGPFMVISIKQHYAGHAMRVADYAMTGLADRPPRYLVLVDEDIDPSSRDQVLWAINTRVDPAAQIHVERDRWCNAINPAGLTPEKRSIEDYTLATVIVDACKPFRLRHLWDKMFKKSDIDEALRQRTAEKWESVLGEWITAPKPV